MIGEEEHFAVWRRSHNQPFSLNGGAFKNMMVDNDHIGLVRENLAQGLYRVFGLGYDGNIGFIVKQTANALPQPHNVMGHNAPNLFVLLILCDGTHKLSLRPEKLESGAGYAARANDEDLKIL